MGSSLEKTAQNLKKKRVLMNDRGKSYIWEMDKEELLLNSAFSKRQQNNEAHMKPLKFNSRKFF